MSRLPRNALAMMLFVAAVFVTMTAHADEFKRVLAFGDSLTWGAQPAKHGKLKRSARVRTLARRHAGGARQ